MENKLKLKVLNGNTAAAESFESENVSIVYKNEYRQGDLIALQCSSCPAYCMVQFEDSLPPSLVYISQREAIYHIPFGADRSTFSPKAFTGNRHLIRARAATKEEIHARHCLTFNPYDRHDNENIFPHSAANIETRGGEPPFASYNAIDGIFENSSHGEWPYQSWGIDRNPSAQLKIDFGREVIIDEIRLTLRADFPHDSYWTQATIEFSDETEETLSLIKTGQPQIFNIPAKTIRYIILKDLIKAEDESPFPALTQIEAYGYEINSK